MGELEGRVALVTGGGSGIGAGCARRLAADAATVVIADFDQSAAERIAAEIGAAASAVAVDVRDPAAVDQLVAGRRLCPRPARHRAQHRRDRRARPRCRPSTRSTRGATWWT